MAKFRNEEITTNIIQSAPLSILKEMYYHEETTDELKVEILQGVQRRAEGQTPNCTHCKMPIIDIPDEYARIQGHVYSREGIQEVGITGLCEYCFDEITKEPDES